MFLDKGRTHGSFSLVDTASVKIKYGSSNLDFYVVIAYRFGDLSVCVWCIGSKSNGWKIMEAHHGG